MGKEHRPEPGKSTRTAAMQGVNGTPGKSTRVAAARQGTAVSGQRLPRLELGRRDEERSLDPETDSAQAVPSGPMPSPAAIARRAGGERIARDTTLEETNGGELDSATPGNEPEESLDASEPVHLPGQGAAPPDEETRAVAAEGVADAGASLPHANAIQASFGRHDVSGIRAAIGGSAASATRVIGATAYAIGNRIAFQSAPDLHTAAHEAAHVVQQRAGVKDLAGGVGAAGDQHEQQADEIADAVVAGVSAEALLGPTGGDSSVVEQAVVQRKEPGAAPSALGRGKGERELVAGQHYKVVGPYAYLLDVAWYSEGAVAQGSNLISVAKTIEILSYLRSTGMFGWATPQALAAAANTIGIPVGLTRPEITMRIGAGVLAVIGLPPNSSAMVSREGDGLHIAVRLETDGLDIGSTIPIDGSSVDAVYRGLEKFTGLPIPAAQRVETFKMNVGTGAVHKRVSSGDLENLFGASAWKAWKSEHSEAKAGAAGAQDAAGAQSVANELTATEQGRLRAWLIENVGASPNANVDETHGTRELLAMVDDIENGSLKRYRAGILEYLRAHRASEGGVAVTPRSFRASIDRAMRHSLGAEHNAVNADTKLAPILDDALPATLTYSRALALDGDTVRFEVAFDWAVLARKQSGLYEQSERGDEFHKRPWNAEVEWVFERLDGPPLTDVERTHHDNKEMHLNRTMKLLPREPEGTWAVHAFVRTSHFPMTRVTTQIRVTSEATRMAELRTEALGELATPDKLQFDGERMSGPLAGTPRDPADRARGRADEITRLEEVKRYLELHSDGRNADAIAAVDVQLGRRREQDKKLVEDTADGWRTFDVRATYLSKVDEVPSGSLDIYGAVKRNSHPEIPGEHITVKLRDVSRRFEQEVYEFEGIGATFEAALQDATKHLTKDYPRGRIALLAEEQDPTGQRSTGKTVGFERETFSTWKAVKEKVFHPIAQLAVAAVSAAVMIFVPPAAAIIPLFIETVYGGVQTVDDLLARADNHTLTMSRMAIDLGTIGLSILPFASAAKSVRSSRRAMFALEVANMGGQVLLMAANVKEHLAMLQATDVAMVAQIYGELLEAEKTYQPSDPRLAELRAQVEARANDVRNRVRDAFSTVVGTQMMFMIPGHVFKAVQVGRTHVESGWVPGDLGTPVEETDWAGLHREMNEDAPSAVPGPRATTHPVTQVPASSPAPAGANAEAKSQSDKSAATTEGPQTAPSQPETTQPAATNQPAAGDARPGAPSGTRTTEGQTAGETGQPGAKKTAPEGSPEPTSTPKPAAGLDGAAVASQVPGAAYESGGTFRITTEHGTTQVSMRRTNGPARNHTDAHGIVIEIPRGLTGTALEHAVVEQLRAAREVANAKAPPKAKKLSQAQEAELLEWVQQHEQAPPPGPGETEKATEMWKHRQQEIRANYEKVLSGELDPPGLHELFGGDRQKAVAALRLAWEKGIPLTYHVAVGKLNPATGKPFASAEEAFAALQADVQAAFAKAGITDGTVQQIGSGTTGWRGNPGTPKKPKEIAPWNPEKDTDFAVFSKQAQYQLLEQSKQRGQAPAVNVPRDGKFTIFKSGAGEGGFYDTPVGRALHEVATKWNEIIYDTTDPKFEGFDFKLNVPTTPFAKAVKVATPELTSLGTQPVAQGATTSAEIVGGKGTNKFLSVPVEPPKEMLKQLPAGAKGRIEYHVTIISPPEMALLSDAAKASIANGVIVGGAPRLKGNIEQVRFASRAPIDWPEANAFRQSLELQPKADVEAALREKPSLAKSVDVSAALPSLKDGDLHVTLTGGVNEAIEQQRGPRAEGQEKDRTTPAAEQRVDDGANAGAKEPKPDHSGDAAATRVRVEKIASEIGDNFKSHPLRQKYEAEVAALGPEADKLISQAQGDRGKLRQGARDMWQKRREISTRYKEVTPELLREYIYWKNEHRTGHDKLGPTWEYLEKKKGYAEIIRSSATPNPDINAFLGGFKEWLLADGARFVK